MVVATALLTSQADNGGDFGIMSDARESLGMDHHKFAGHVARLQPFIEWTEDLSRDAGVNSSEIQFGLTDACTKQHGGIRAVVKRFAAPQVA